MSWLWGVFALIAIVFAFLPTGALFRGLRELWLTWKGKSTNMRPER